MFQRVKDWFFKKQEVPVEQSTLREVEVAIVPRTKEPVPALTTEQIGAIEERNRIGSVVYSANVSIHSACTVPAACTSVYATQFSTLPVKKPRKPRTPKAETWPFPIEKPLAAVTPEELEALKAQPAAIKIKKPRKKAAFVPKQD